MALSGLTMEGRGTGTSLYPPWWMVRPRLQSISSNVSTTVFTQPLQVLFKRSFSLKYFCPSGVLRSQPFSSLRQMQVPCFNSNRDMSSRTFRYVSSVTARFCPSPRPCLSPMAMIPPLTAPQTSCRRAIPAPNPHASLRAACLSKRRSSHRTSKEPLGRNYIPIEISARQHRFWYSCPSFRRTIQGVRRRKNMYPH